MCNETITIQELAKMDSFDDLYKASIKITLEHTSMLEEYFALRLEKYGTGGMFAYFLHPMFSKTSSNFRFRFVRVVVNDDEVLVPFKYVSVHITKYVRLYGIPISLNNNEDSVQQVFSLLVDSKLVKQIQYTPQELDELKELGLDDISIETNELIDDDYYNKVDETWKKISKSRWRAKYSINVLNNMDNLVFRKIEEDDIDKTQQLSDYWEQNKKSISNKRLTGNILKALRKDIRDEGMLAYGLFYKDTMVGFTVFFPCFDGEYVHHVILKNLAKVNEKDIKDILNKHSDEDSENIEKIIINVGRFMFYKSVEAMADKEVHAMYMAGATDKEQLKTNKKCLNDNCIDYYKYEVY